MQPRVAVVLFNLGGPDRPEVIRTFLLNIFRDPAILRVPFFVRPFLARLIAARRLEPAQTNYRHLGGRSPLLALTRSQATALEAELSDVSVKCFISMRYWHPMTDATVRAVRTWRPDEIVLLPLYPHYSTTTTGSSLNVWQDAAARVGLAARTTTLCCYPTALAYVASIVASLQRALLDSRSRLPPTTTLRVLFSAHGLPEIIVRRGDPYQWQIEQTVAAVLSNLNQPDLDWTICYQSRATPQRWIGPSTEAEIERSAHDKVAVLVVPIAFVSDHSETLVELDIDYRVLAEKLNVPGYFRAPTQNADPGLITAIASLVRHACGHGPGLGSHTGGRICPPDRRNCAFGCASVA